MNKIKRALIMADGAYITPGDMQLKEASAESIPLNMKEIREDAERKAILRAMNLHRDNISDMANALGITRPTLYSMIDKLGLKK